MDGCLHVVSLDSHQRHTLPAHTKPVSVVRCGGGRVVSGGYDGTVVVHRMTDLERERTVTVHSGSRVTSLALDCVSGNSLVTESHFQFQSWPLFRGFTLCWYLWGIRKYSDKHALYTLCNLLALCLGLKWTKQA